MKKVKSGHFAAYILKCSDGTLYSGYANDLDKRLECHNRGKGAKYTRGRLPVKLAWHRDFKYLICALKEEAALKRMTRKRKERLIMAYEKNDENFF